MPKKVEIPINAFKVFVRFNFPVTQSTVIAVAKQGNNRIILLPSGTDVIVVDNKGKATKY